MPRRDALRPLTRSGDAAGFARYRADPDVAALAPLREQAVTQAVFITGRRLDYI